MTEIGPLDALFEPHTVAVIGASTDPMKFGGLPVYYSALRDFKGRLCPVNARAPEVQGLPSFASVQEIDGPVDCAVVSVPAAAVQQALEDCAEKGVGAAIIFSSGYAEVNEEGRRAQERITALGREAGMRIVGPNCMGSFDLHSNFIATFTSAFRHFDGDGWPKTGTVGVVSQSGAVGIHIIVQLRDRGVGISKWLTTGNQCDVDVADGIAHMAADQQTRVIVAYLEGCPDGGRFRAAVDAARAAGKPVLALKVGATEAGAAAAASHTASLAGADAVFDAVFRQHGVFRAKSFPHLVDIAAGCAQGAFPKGRRVGVVTISGGVGAMMADASEAAGVVLPPVSEAAQKRMFDIVPFCAPRNPVDTAAPGMQDLTIAPDFSDIVLDDGGVDAVAIFMTHIGHLARRQDELRQNFGALRDKHPDPIMALSISGPAHLRDWFVDKGFFVCEDPTATIDALGALAWIGEKLAAGVSAPPPEIGDTDAPPPGPSAEHVALDHLARAGIPVVPHKLAISAEDAASAAGQLGFPVIIKIASADIAHKSDIGGVLLGLDSADAVTEGFGTLLQRAKQHAPDATVDGVLVAPMVADGVETILGVQTDPIFGPVVMFGIGGVFVEIYRDVAFRVAPFGVDEARSMIEEVKGVAMLEGARGRPPADIDALAAALSRLSVYADRHRDTIETIDINPFIVGPDGATAVDALIIGRDTSD